MNAPQMFADANQHVSVIMSRLCQALTSLNSHSKSIYKLNIDSLMLPFFLLLLVAEGQPCLVQSDCQGEGLKCDLSPGEGGVPQEKCINAAGATRSNTINSFSSKTNSRDIGTQISIDSLRTDTNLDNPSSRGYRQLHLSTSGDFNNKQSLSSFASSTQDQGTQCKYF